MNNLIVFLLVLLSSFVSVAYQIDGITIETCDADGCMNRLPRLRFSLNCNDCVGSSYVYLKYKRDFSINCNDDGTVKSTYYTQAKNEVHLCEDNTRLVELLINTTFVEVMTSMVAIESECDDDDIKENEIKLIAATLQCTYFYGFRYNCPFLYDTESCNVTFGRFATNTTVATLTSALDSSTSDPIKSIVIPILVILLLGVVVTILIVMSVVCWLKLRSKHIKPDPNPILHPIFENVYADITDTNLENRIRSNSKDLQAIYSDLPTSNEYGMIINELYGALVEGAVPDSKLYQELPCLKNQSVYSSGVSSLYSTVPTNPFIEPSSSLTELDSTFKSRLYEITTQEIDFGEMFASGQFGVVYRGTYKTEKGDIPVAVKQLKESANNDALITFMREAASMAQFSHPNVLRLLGVITTRQPWMIVTELLKTELREFLIKLRDSPSIEHMQRGLLVKFSVEIADGMEYLAMRKFVHRDLAARNVLVAKDLTVRIADFGMSREIGSESDYYTSSGGILPLRWTAPEAVFYQKYSEKSDVWSYGMTLYEIWSLGDIPWGEDTNQEIISALSLMKSISPPHSCPEVVGKVMMETWQHDKQDRPTFTEVRGMLSTL